METAVALITQDKYGSTVMKFDVTPAELLVLAHSFAEHSQKLPIPVVSKEGNASESVVKKLWFIKDRPVDPKRLVQFLGAKYVTRNTEDGTTTKVVTKLFPGANPNLPATFKEAGYAFTTGDAPERQLKACVWTPDYQPEQTADLQASFFLDEEKELASRSAADRDQEAVIS